MATVNRTELLQIHSEVCNKARRLMERKNHDYSGGDNQEDPFLNFTRVEKLGITTTEQGFLVRMTDKVSRLITFCQTGTFKVEDEKLDPPRGMGLKFDEIEKMIDEVLAFEKDS